MAQQVLQSLGIRRFAPQVSACPGCGRTSSALFSEMAARVQDHIRSRMPLWRRLHPGVENLTVAVMGCVVNGPGESRHADIGVSLPGRGEDPKAPVYIDGVHAATLEGDALVGDFIAILEKYVARRYSAVS